MGDEFYSLTCLIGVGALQCGFSERGLAYCAALCSAISSENNQ